MKIYFVLVTLYLIGGYPSYAEGKSEGSNTRIWKNNAEKIPEGQARFKKLEPALSRIPTIRQEAPLQGTPDPSEPRVAITLGPKTKEKKSKHEEKR